MYSGSVGQWVCMLFTLSVSWYFLNSQNSLGRICFLFWNMFRNSFLSLYLSVDNFILRFYIVLLTLNLIWDLLSFIIWTITSFTRFRQFSHFISLNKHPVPLSFSFFSLTSIIQFPHGVLKILYAMSIFLQTVSFQTMCLWFTLLLSQLAYRWLLMFFVHLIHCVSFIISVYFRITLKTQNVSISVCIFTFVLGLDNDLIHFGRWDDMAIREIFEQTLVLESRSD